MYQNKNVSHMIIQSVSMKDVISMYVPDVHPRRNRIPCPIHNGNHYNLGFNDETFHCFVCHACGNVIHFTMYVFHLSFQEAILKLNCDFQLGLPIGRKPTIREQRDMARKIRYFKEKRAEQEAEKRAYEVLYTQLWDQWIEYDKIIRSRAPASPNELPDPKWLEAICNIDYISYRIDSEL